MKARNKGMKEEEDEREKKERIVSFFVFVFVLFFLGRRKEINRKS